MSPLEQRSLDGSQGTDQPALKVQAPGRSVHKGESSPNSDNRTVEEAKGAIVADQAECIEPNLLIKPGSPEAAVTEDEALKSVSSYNRIKDISCASEEH